MAGIYQNECKMADNNGFAGDDDGISMQGRRRRVWVAMGAIAAAVLVIGVAGCDDAATNAPSGASTTTVNTSAPRLVNPDTSLARTHLCLACHQPDRQLVGPSFLAIAQRYAGTEGALDYLAASIRDGGQGRWGALTMPRQPQVSLEDARKLAQWLLELVPPKQTANPSTTTENLP